ncbi:cyclic pyranopterin monophosphate synthase MoaC [Bowmanella pacifica]|uniref:Cyclic pyranopterin monophosphate synthase n=1 Tax=Bowmanella pacifica TaxID=502051 RepID=A0A917Z1S8_9ALTE|nr:cyclic pyranopterin monophosphate synthase MoaC [Bowmanella pacifica]GGO70598.1 cyclic pyranopterin monophosphate synthase accessory protein [Bowmanella pacifica]
MTGLTHLNNKGEASMVDVSHKQLTHRLAMAVGYVAMQPDTLARICAGMLPKGDVFAVARVAGIQAAKQCASLVPLCHPLMLSDIQVAFKVDADNVRVEIQATCKVTGQTGVEMEALTAVSVAALTLFDMCKAIDPAMQIGGIRVITKSGGKSGHWQAREDHD